MPSAEYFALLQFAREGSHRDVTGSMLSHRHQSFSLKGAMEVNV